MCMRGGCVGFLVAQPAPGQHQPQGEHRLASNRPLRGAALRCNAVHAKLSAAASVDCAPPAPLTPPTFPRLQVALVAATNRRSAVDAALRRAGRLDLEVALGPLTQQDRLEVRGSGRSADTAGAPSLPAVECCTLSAAA